MTVKQNEPAHDEKAFLESVVKTYVASETSQDRELRELMVRTFSPYVIPGRGIELGCSDGFMTERLARLVSTLDVLDGSETFIDTAKKRKIPNAAFHHTLFEDWKADQRVENIFCTHVLEHLSEVRPTLEMVRETLQPNGRFFVVVPNAFALSRQLAYHMGLLEDLKELTENDRKHGHRRVYDRVSLNRELVAAGFEIVAQGGIQLKLLADFQMTRLIDDGTLQRSQLDGLYKLGFQYPDLCGAVFAICQVSTEDSTTCSDEA